MAGKSAKKKISSRSDSTLRRYEYERLPTNNHIRILTLFPGETHEAVTCHLAAVPFDKTENIYEAISYCWGDPMKKVNIICNGRRLAVTVNLRDALQSLRDLQRVKLLWADAACINQADDVEKGHQVQKMGEIYQNAKAVRVWLGRDDDGIAEDCFNLIRETINYLTIQVEIYGHYEDFPRLAQPFPISDEAERWVKVKALTSLPWFSRVWVIQEVSLAKVCDLRWGDHLMEIADLLELCCWDMFRTDIKAITGDWPSGMLLSLFGDFYATYGNTKSWRASRQFIRHQSDMYLKGIHKATFAGLLRSSSRVTAFDPRDHVYGFLGHPLARTDSGQPFIEPAYGKPLRDVYIDVAIKLLQITREAPSVLTSVMHATLEDIEGSVFPSWVPRWNVNMASIAFPLATGYAWYAAGGPTPAKSEMHEYGVLSIHGIAFDTIAWTSLPFRKENLGFDSGMWEACYRAPNISFIDDLWQTVLPSWDGPVDEFEHIFSVALVREYPANKRGVGSLHRDKYLAYCHSLRNALNSSHYDPYASEEFAGYADKFRQCVETSYNRKMVITKAGRIGMAPFYARPGDVSCLIPGVAVPLILRCKDNGRYNLVGDSYIHGAMKGEIMGLEAKGELTAKIMMIE